MCICRPIPTCVLPIWERLIVCLKQYFTTQLVTGLPISFSFVRKLTVNRQAYVVQRDANSVGPQPVRQQPASRVRQKGIFASCLAPSII
jgi:hypothetical protein